MALARREISVDGRRDRVIALTAHLAQVRRLPVLQPWAFACARSSSRVIAGREQRVVFGLERRQLLAADIGAAARHHHRGIPAQQRQRAAERVQAPEFLLELLVRRG